MAGTTVTRRRTGAEGSDVKELVEVQLGNIITDLETLRAGLDALADAFNLVLAKLDADGGVTDADYAATHAVTVTSYDTAGDLVTADINAVA